MTRAESPAWSRIVAVVLRKLCEVTQQKSARSKARRTSRRVFFGSRSPPSEFAKRGFPLRYSWSLAGRGFRGSGDAGPQHLVVTRFQEYQDGNPLFAKTGSSMRTPCERRS